MADTIKVTKLDAARRQLLTAIDLWFADRDPIAIHALAYASHEVIHRLFRLKGLKDLMFDSSVVKEEQRPEWNRLLKSAGNFIKHAKIENDPNAAIEFSPFTNDMYIIMSLEGLRRMGEELSPTELAFLVWNHIHRPTYFFSSILENRFPVDTVEQLRALKRSEFLERFLKSWSWGKIG